MERIKFALWVGCAFIFFGVFSGVFHSELPKFEKSVLIINSLGFGLYYWTNIIVNLELPSINLKKKFGWVEFVNALSIYISIAAFLPIALISPSFYPNLGIIIASSIIIEVVWSILKETKLVKRWANRR